MKVTWIEGLADYGDVYARQMGMVDERIADPSLADELLLLEHASVYTIGRTRNHSSLHDPGRLPHPVVEINRGGQATYHGPGQLVGYPIVRLDHFGKDIHAYVETLEQTLIRTCESFGVPAKLREGLVGVWVEDRKIASIGVGVRKWVTMHGFAINITKESLPPFWHITPCGIEGVTMTCLENEIEKPLSPCPNLLREFGNRFTSFWQETLSLHYPPSSACNP